MPKLRLISWKVFADTHVSSSSYADAEAASHILKSPPYVFWSFLFSQKQKSRWRWAPHTCIYRTCIYRTCIYLDTCLYIDKVLYKVTLNGNYTRALTFENFYSAAVSAMYRGLSFGTFFFWLSFGNFYSALSLPSQLSTPLFFFVFNFYSAAVAAIAAITSSGSISGSFCFLNP